MILSAAMPKGTARALVESERALLPDALTEEIDLRRVRIVSRWHTPIARLFNSVVTRGWKIFWPGAPVETLTPAQRALLAHELVHVWQYQALGRNGLELLLDRVYRYDLQEGKPFLDYGHEQQAAIVEDLIRLQTGLPLKWAMNDPPEDRYLRTHGTACFDIRSGAN
jgi:hypothetical protein